MLCALLAVPGCLGGERALAGGDCPADETCSDQTPHGLWFRGAGITGGDLLPPAISGTAIGGVQTITLDDVATGAPLAVPWRAELRDALVVERQEGPRVIVKGVAEGLTSLRIVDPATGALHDRHGVSARAVTAVTARAGGELLLGQWLVGDPASDQPPLWIAGADIDAGIALESSGERVVDEQLTVALAEPGGASLERLAWDRVVVRGASGGTVALTVSAGTLRDQRVELTVVDAIDGVVDGFRFASEPTRVGQTSSYCFEGRRGDRVVVGLGWTFTVEGPAVEHSRRTNCVNVQANAPGRVTLTATAAGHSVQRIVDVIAGDASARAVADDALDLTGSPGDRARATW